MANYLQKNNVNVPPFVKPGMAITAEWANSMRSAILRTGNFNFGGGKGDSFETATPFLVFVNQDPPDPEDPEADPTYYAVVNEGTLVEISTKGASGPVMIYHKPANNERDAEGMMPHFTITPGQAVYLKYQTDAVGQVKTASGSAPEIVVDADNKAGVHYYPTIGTYAGQEGTVWRKLATFSIDDGIEKVTHVESGHHLEHWRELPKFRKEEGTHDVFYRYNLSTGEYLTKGLSADIEDDDDETETIAITDTFGGDLKFRTNGKTCDIIFEDCDGDPMAEPPVSPTQILRLAFVRGLLVGVDETTVQRPLSETVVRKKIQSCHWVDDPV